MSAEDETKPACVCGDPAAPGVHHIDAPCEAPLPMPDKFRSEASSPPMPWGAGPRPEGWQDPPLPPAADGGSGGPFRRRGHPERGFGYKPDKRHLAGFPVKSAHAILSLRPTPSLTGGLDEAPIRALGILDQGQAPFCVSHGTAGALRDCQQRNGVVSPRLASRLWIMFLAHALEHDTDGFDGAIIADAFQAIETLGFPPEELWPYSDEDPGPFSVQPPQEVYTAAFDRKAPTPYSRILSEGDARVDDVLRALQFGAETGHKCPVVFGTNVSNAFAGNQLPPGFVCDVPDPGDIDGGHCMRLIRSEADAGVAGGVKLRGVNSWGEEWGDGGMFWMTPAWLKDPSTSDIWVADFQGTQP